MKKRKFYFFLEDENVTGTLKIKRLTNLTLGEIANGFVDNSEDVSGGVYAWNGDLEIRPKFQRAFVVDSNKRWQTELIHSVLNNRPIGTMYFGVSNNGKKYIVIDAQQRLITLCSFINNENALPMYNKKTNTVEDVLFDQLDEEWQRAIKTYKPQINVCYGSEEELLSWFITINQPISELTPQELRNAAYNGIWNESAKMRFSKVKESAHLTEKNVDFLSVDGDYYYGNYSSKKRPERQEVLEMAIRWAALQHGLNGIGKDIDIIDSYMEMYKDSDDNASDLVQCYKNVIDWVNNTFFHDGKPKNAKSYQSVRNQDWGYLYAKYGRKESPDYIELTEEQKDHISKRTKEIVGYGSAMYQTSEGVYEWVLRGEKIEEENEFLHLRKFSDEDKQKMYISQKGLDPINGQHYEIEDMEGHHIIPWRNGGLTTFDNLVMLSKDTHKNLDCLGLTPNDIKAKRDALVSGKV